MAKIIGISEIQIGIYRPEDALQRIIVIKQQNKAQNRWPKKAFSLNRSITIVSRKFSISLSSLGWIKTVHPVKKSKLGNSLRTKTLRIVIKPKP